MSTPPVPRARQQIGELANAVYSELIAAKFSKEELIEFGHAIYGGEKPERLSAAIVRKLIGIAERLDARFPLPEAKPSEPEAVNPGEAKASNGHSETPANVVMEPPKVTDIGASAGKAS